MLSIQNLRKEFGDHVAIKDVSFDVPSGKMVGFLGGNGAGKTTTMRMIMGTLEPTSGDVLFDGHPVTNAHRSRFGYMPEERGLYPKQSLEGQLRYLAELKGESSKRARLSAIEYLERFGLGDRRKDALESLSLGNQQRVQIIASIMVDPICLILDEPFSGLDPQAIDDMSEVLRDVTRKGTPVLFSSHQLDMVDRLCDEIVALADGEIKASGNLESLTQGRPLKYRVITDDEKWIDALPGVTKVVSSAEDARRRVDIEVSCADQADQILKQGVSEGVIYEFSRVMPTLSQIYSEVVK